MSTITLNNADGSTDTFECDEETTILEGLEEAGLDKLVNLAYSQLGLITFFTVGPKEIRAWTIHQNTLAPQAAGAIHSDFERGFIKAEVYTYSDLMEFQSELKIKENGKLRQEGKDYIVQD